VYEAMSSAVLETAATATKTRAGSVVGSTNISAKAIIGT